MTVSRGPRDLHAAHRWSSAGHTLSQAVTECDYRWTIPIRGDDKHFQELHGDRNFLPTFLLCMPQDSVFIPYLLVKEKCCKACEIFCVTRCYTNTRKIIITSPLVNSLGQLFAKRGGTWRFLFRWNGSGVQVTNKNLIYLWSPCANHPSK